MTLIFSPDKPLELITPAAAVAVCEALEDFGVKNLGIKWVNDIFLDGKKVCGILCEHFFEGGKEYLSAGIGINLTTDEFPEQLTAAGSINLDLPKAELSDAIAEKLLKYANNPNNSFVCSEYEKRLFFLGKNISFIQNGIPFSAVALGINNNCNLKVLLPDSSVKVLSSGEISIKI